MDARSDDPPSRASSTATGRLVWLLKGPKAGDFMQMRALAAALPAPLATPLARVGGWNVETRTLVFRRTELLQHLWPRPTLGGLDRARSDALAPPWPDLLLTAGRRNELVARWVKQQSGGRTRIVHLGRPWSRPGVFDLVITTPQYTLREAARILINDLPLHDVTAESLEAASAEWQDELGATATPRLAVLVGGDSGPFVFDAALADRMALAVNGLVRRSHAGLWLSTSGRTPRAFCDRLVATLDVPAHRYVPGPGPQATHNPYRGYLALADAFVVTSESVSMIAETVATGKPVWLFDVSAPATQRFWFRTASWRWKPLTHRLAQTYAPERYRRDVRRIHARLIAAGRVTWLDETSALSTRPSRRTGTDELERSAAAVRALFNA